MKRNQRLLAAALSCLLLVGCGVQTQQAEKLAFAETAGDNVAYVPLDDRPDNVERVEYLAQSLGYALELPPADWCRTRLDAQPRNDNGTPYGDLGKLYDWVAQQEEQGCDRYILSLDQMLSGGLVNSRHVSGHLTASVDGETVRDDALLERLIALLAADGDNQVWLLESVMRLAPTVGYAGFGLEEYNALRAYGMEPRPAVNDGSSVERVEAAARLGADGKELDAAAFGLTGAQVETYLASRSRKLELSRKLLELVGTSDGFHVLIGIDDSSAEECIQKNEIALLRQGLREGDALLSGVDDLAFKAIAKLYLEEIGWSGAEATVRYFGGMEDQPACAYDFQSLRQIMEEHFAFFDLTATENASLQVLVLTQPADETMTKQICKALQEALREAEKAHRPVILIDAGNGRYGTAFHQMLTEKIQLGRLLSYAGFLDMAIVTGTALSHGVARYAFLQSEQATVETETAFARTLADSILKDFCYKNVVREELLGMVRGELKGSPDNFWNPAIDREALTEYLSRAMAEQTAPVLKNLERSNLPASLEPWTERGWGTVTLKNYRFPWDRAFEIGMDLEIGEFVAPHKTLFRT